MKRYRKRKTDWLFANSIFIEATLDPGQSDVELTTPFLPTEYIDQDAEGSCTLVRIVGDFGIWAVANQTTSSLGAGNPLELTMSLLRTQVDDSGVVNQLSVDPYEVPGLGASAVVGGARSFLWSKRLFWVSALSANAFLPFGGYAIPGGFDRPTFDLRVKRRLQTGEALVFHTKVHLNTPETVAAIGVDIFLAYRILVALRSR